MAVNIDKGSALSSLNITPLIDVVFLLLIFFLVATKFAEIEREQDVKLPEASEAKPMTDEPNELFINIDDKGRYFVSGEMVELPRLDEILKQAYINNPGNASVIIRADERSMFKFVFAARNACIKARIFDVSEAARGAGSKS
ncbi:MAG TPA: biopolymer transporter ExbD [Thermoguttaceae bacterium]|nr:biopolymer transporter ExbD [Thermoguttaceae bacterium]